MRALITWGMLAATALWLAGCATAETLAPTDDADAEAVDSQVIDARPAPDAALLGAFGAPCARGLDCQSGHCIDTAEYGQICTQPCGTCPPDFECRAVANGGADRLVLCLPDTPALCAACTTDRDCDDLEDLCLPYPLGQFCGEDCSDDGVCPPGYDCADVMREGALIGQQCVPAEGMACGTCVDADGDGFGDGPDCQGFDCDDGDAQVYRGAPEICDGKDNDCNARADDAPQDAPDLDCDGPGLCAGNALACVGGAWGCQRPAAYEPDAEQTCDGLDNDCDGAVDEALRGTLAHCGGCNQACAPPNAEGRCEADTCVAGPCAPGFVDVDGRPDTGCEYACVPDPEPTEVCDQRDNDCDGQIDEGYDLDSDPAHCGRCGTFCARPNATWLCVQGACVFEGCGLGFHELDGDVETGCEYACRLDGAEACDGEDDDCDGRIDEGTLNACGQCGPAPAEVCDGVDNDCNGTVDDAPVCGPFVQTRCRLFIGWADRDRGPNGVSDSWAGCPGVAENPGGDPRCVSTDGAGSFVRLDLLGDVNDDDEVGLALRCDGGDRPDLNDYVQRHCAVFLGHADVSRGVDTSNRWGPIPDALVGDDGSLRGTSTGFDGRFRALRLVGDVDENDDWGVAWICRDPQDPARAAALQASAAVFMAWADRNSGPANRYAPTWGPCPALPAGTSGPQRCTSSRGDGLFHRLDLNGIAGDVNGDDDVGFALRAR